MDKKPSLYLGISVIVLVGLLSGYLLGAKVDKGKIVRISDFTFTVSQQGAYYTAIFQGDLVNPGLGVVRGVKVIIHWTEMNNQKHVNSLNIGDLAGQETQHFKIEFQCEYMLLIKSVSPTLEWS